MSKPQKRLYDTIRTNYNTSICCYRKEDRQAYRRFLDCFLEDAEVFEISNIFDYWEEHVNKPGIANWESLYSCCYPPYNNFWMEYVDKRIGPIGTLFICQLPTTEYPYFTLAATSFCKSSVTVGELRKGDFAPLPLAVEYKLDLEGQLLCTKKFKHFDNYKPSEDKMEHACIGTQLIQEPCLMALQIMNVKNAQTQIISPPDTRSRKQKRWGQPQAVTYKTIIISPVGARQPASDAQCLTLDSKQTAAHKVRGHIGEYGVKGKGLLFGKLSGRFWFGPHIRGHIENGEVIKDYKVVTSDPHLSKEERPGLPEPAPPSGEG